MLKDKKKMFGASEEIQRWYSWELSVQDQWLKIVAGYGGLNIDHGLKKNNAERTVFFMTITKDCCECDTVD